SATSDSDEGADENENNSRNIRILNNIVLQPPKVTPKKNTSMRETNVKDEDKKINFAYVDVMKDFFLNILNTNHLKCLLNNHQKDLLNTFFNIDRKYQYTCIKLYMWKPIWYNIFKYADRISLQMQDSLKELREIQRSFKFTNSTNTRESIISKLLKNCKTQVTLTCTKSTEQVLRDRIQEKLGLCIKLSDQLSKALYNMYLLNTFTNSSVMKPQDYFKDLNIVFPDYQVENYHIFYTPEEFLQYASAVELRNALENAIEKKNTSHIFEICKLAHKMLKELNKNGSAYNDTKIWLEYLLDQKYFSCKRGHWYYHLSLIYTAYLREYETVSAAKLLISAFEKDKENLSEVQLHELAYRGKILDKRTYNLSAFFHDQIAILSPPSCDRDWPQTVVESRTMRSNEPGRKRKYVQQCENGDVNYLTVEQTALEHYRISGYPEGEHCEGSLICVAFCLLFWDIIYESYVKGTFVAKIQSVPLDMYTNYFYVNREHLIKMRLNQIRTNWKEEELKRNVIEKWTNHSHETSLLQIDSIVDNPERLLRVIMCIGRLVLSKIFERLVKNYKVYCSGFPDLIVWNFEAKKAKFVEVKGENDKLSIKQKLWLNYLLDIGADVQVCHVH
ncbi:fanconi-associated nuclease 1 -like, partial [Asbolus verrucosus]